MPKAMPLGTVRLMKRWGAAINMVKISHHGPKWVRWRPQSTIEAEKQHGPLPAEHQVYHLDGNPLNDSPDNLIVTRCDRLRLNLQRNRTAQRKQREKRTSAVQRSNRIRSRVGRSVHIRLGQFYPVSHATRTIIVHPFRTKHQAERCGEQDEYRHLQLVAIRGARLDTECADYARIIPDEGQAWVRRRKGEQ